MRRRAYVIPMLLAAGCSSVPDVRFVDAAAESTIAAPSDSGPSDSGTCPPGAGVCCGRILCTGCSNAESGECRECESACGPGQRCCKQGGPPVCIAAAQTCPAN